MTTSEEHECWLERADIKCQKCWDLHREESLSSSFASPTPLVTDPTTLARLEYIASLAHEVGLTHVTREWIVTTALDSYLDAVATDLDLLPKEETGDDGLTDRQREEYAREWRETGARKPDAAELSQILEALDRDDEEHPPRDWIKWYKFCGCMMHGDHLGCSKKQHCRDAGCKVKFNKDSFVWGPAEHQTHGQQEGCPVCEMEEDIDD